MSYQQPVYGAPPSGAYYINVLGQEQGPLDVGQLHQMALAGQLKSSTIVRSADNPNQFPAGQIPGLFSDKSKMIAGLLEIFLGSFGVGRFYLGYTGLGIAQIAVVWLTCGLGAIWPLIDGIMMLLGKVPDSDNRPLID
ncbi:MULTISPECIES: NINE protein [unclassified Gordonia (in: high G+C Gram-positive bacteria)]|uniref:NINE protein n=1 Tax=unclassified Gordonia (in: high G+C Gram-positive bacteria) TaxID=2657482 RepID=UPI001F0E6CED|nr:NINE protein [Gordonia sp. ABSL49_1]MCH5642000.1 NINE protein [Gordonia sp. ABSL49_1]